VKRRALIAAGALLALVAAFLGGRFSRPAETKTETVTVYAAHAKDSGSLSLDSGQQARERVVTVTKREPGGTVYVTETTDRLLSSDLELDLEWSREAESKGEAKATTTTTSRPSWRLDGQAGWSRLSPAPDIYGIGISRRVAGTLWVGGWARTDKTAGLGVGLEW
jgi:hypothetical protein